MPRPPLCLSASLPLCLALSVSVCSCIWGEQVSDGLDNPQTGRVAHALCAVLQEELAKYYRLIAALEAQHATSGGERGSGRGGGSGLTLRRLLVRLTRTCSLATHFLIQV